MNFQRTIFSIFISVILISGLYGQENEFYHYGLANGLSQSVVNCIFQDSDGFLWFGTQNGLNRFDGYGFKKYMTNYSDPSSIIDNWIYAIAEDKIGNLWIGTKKGLARYDRKTNKFEKIEIKPKDKFLPNNAVNSLCTSSKGNIIINTNGMLIIIDPIKNTLIHYFTGLPAEGSIYDQNRPIIEDKNGSIWFGTQFGLCKFSPETKKFSKYNLNSKPALSDIDITALYQDISGRILIGTTNGLFEIDPIKNEISKPRNIAKYLNNLVIRAICRDKTGNIWIATENGGLGRIKNFGKNESIDFFVKDPNNQQGLSHNIIYSLFMDKSDLLWIGTLDGINKLDLKKKKFQLYRKTNDPTSINLADNVVASLYKDKNNMIWIGTWGAGLNIYNRKTAEIKHYAEKFKDYRHIPNNFVHIIYKDSENRIWIGTRNGLLIYNSIEQSFIDYRTFFHNSKLPDFSDNRIFCINQTQNRQLTIGTANGLYILDLKSEKMKSYFAEDSTISSNLVYSVIEDKDSELWIGTTNGLDRFNPKTGAFRHYRKIDNDINSIIDNFIVSLCIDKKGLIWTGTNSGLCRLDKKNEKFEFFEDFPNDVIYNILEDKDNNLWFSSGFGLIKYNYKTAEFTRFGIEDGLQSLEFNLKACFKSDDGEMFFGGMNGFNSFYPDSIQKNKYIPSIVITSIEKENPNGKYQINFLDSGIIVLTHKDFAISFDFASLDFTHPEKNKYAYEMIGLSDKKIEYGNSRHIAFLNLSPGDYEFRVYGTNSDGIWNEKPAKIKIKVLPPWWRSRFAYIAYLVLIILIIFLYIKLRERKLKYEKLFLEKKVKERTQEILEQKNEIEAQKDEILAQRDEIEKQRNYVTEQRDQISLKNQEINDSLLYAEKIQTAVLPPKNYFSEVFSDFFILYLPKAIVSGDFYWIKKTAGKYFITVADCTGHGVPGAFVSMLGISILNEIIHTATVESAGEILNKLRVKIKEAMQQTGKPDEAKDGMDISLIGIDVEKLKLEFAGANNSGVIIHNKTLIQLNADKMPIGIYSKELDFNTIEMEISKDDIIYLFSDGYFDQFGGQSRRKFMYRNFIGLLEKIHHLPLSEQYQKLHKALVDWQGNHEQVDDITVIGLKI